MPPIPVPDGRARTAAHVDLDAIRHNAALLCDHAAGAEVMAVVKADGYGHGLVPAARAALAGGASWLGVAYVEEALALRAAGIGAPVLAWLHVPGESLVSAIEAGVDVSVSDLGGLARVVEAVTAGAGAVAGPARVHLKVDTGLSRSGAAFGDWPELCAAAARAEGHGAVRVVAVWSHFAYADAPGHPTVARQTAVFTEAREIATAAGLRPPLRHLANSAATLTSPQTHLDLVRPGIAIYGLSPVPAVASARELGLRPAMTLTSRVALVKRVPTGSGVSYGHRYTTTRPSTLALVPLGYADGIPRAATNIGPVWLAGARRRISGTVSMDQVVVDLGDDTAEVGDEVVLFGPGDEDEPTAQDWAEVLDTISYEIVTRVGVRVPRVYQGEVS